MKNQKITTSDQLDLETLGSQLRAKHTDEFRHHPSTSPVIIVWKIVGQHLILNIIPINFMVEIGRKVWCDGGIMSVPKNLTGLCFYFSNSMWVWQRRALFQFLFVSFCTGVWLPSDWYIHSHIIDSTGWPYLLTWPMQLQVSWHRNCPYKLRGCYLVTFFDGTCILDQCG